MIYPDIASFLLGEAPIINWDSAQKQELQDRFCSSLGYSGFDDLGEIETKNHFFNRKICEYISERVYADKTNEVLNTTIAAIEKMTLGA